MGTRGRCVELCRVLSLRPLLPLALIALARLIPAGVDVRGNATRARIVLFRKPIERRAKDTAELADLLHEGLVAQVATFLGVEPSVIDPTIDDD